MTTTFETGHAKNVANFQHLISFCVGYNAEYNPSNEALTIASLQTQLAAAQAAMENCSTTETAYNNAVHEKQDAFADLKSLSTKVVNAFAVSGVHASVIENAKSINKKLQGQRIGTIEKNGNRQTDTETPPAHKHISVSHQSYDNLLENFHSLIELISSHIEYKPNETRLKVASLQTYLTGLKTANDNAVEANTTWSNSRIHRDKIMYGETTGLLDTALNVKNYIKSIFGANSPEYAQVKGIQFKKV